MRAARIEHGDRRLGLGSSRIGAAREALPQPCGNARDPVRLRASLRCGAGVLTTEHSFSPRRCNRQRLEAMSKSARLRTGER